MRWIGWKSIGLGGAAGAACAAVLWSSLGTPASPVASTLPVTAPLSTASTSTIYLDCTPPAQLEGEECVTHVVETTVAAPAAAAAVVPAVAAPAASAATSATSPRSSTSSTPAATTATSTSTHHDDDDDHRESTQGATRTDH